MDAGHATRGCGLEQRAPGAEGLRLAIGAIFKNEGPYILEWVAYHRALGVDRFFVADNGSDDGSSEFLAALDQAGVIDHIPFPGTPGQPPQLPAYAEILRRHGGQADWIAFIDADEFLLPAAPARSLRPVLAELDRLPGVGAVAVNWAAYGSAGEEQAQPGLVIERFPARALRDTLLNHHYKTILRPRAFAGVHETPHLFRLRAGFRAVHADGSPLTPYGGHYHGLSKAILWSPLRLNHYVVKSREEFFQRKRLRGRATKNATRDATFFAVHDRNEEREPMASWLIEATRAERQRLLERLRAAGWSGAEPALRRAAGALQAALPGAARPGPAGATGRIDRIEVTGQVARIRGWALTAGRAPMTAFLVRIGGQPVELVDVARLARPDVVRTFPGADPVAGFVLTFAWEGLEDGPDAPLSVLAIGPGGAGQPLALPHPLAWSEPLAAARAQYASVPEAPIMPPAGAAALAEALGGARCYLEYGSGGSTMLAVASGVADIVSVESDRLWLEAVRAQLAGRLRPGHHHLCYADIGPTAQFGAPASERHWRRFPAYALDAWALCRARGLAPDLVLIDGRFRAACLLATLIHAQPGCRVLFDDYAERPGYHRVARFLEPRRLIDRVAEFSVPEAPPTEALWHAFVEAVGDPL
jgi:hypothetical protein